MARYNTINQTATVSGASSTSPLTGQFTELTGTAPYTVTVPSPNAYPGYLFSFYNNSSGVITLSTPSGTFTGPGGSGTSTFALPLGSSISLNSDGTNYYVVDSAGGPIVASGLTATGTISLTPTNANIAIQASGTGVLTMSSGATGSLDNVTIGGTTPKAGSFTSLSVSGGIQSTAVGNTTPSTGAFTTLTANNTFSLTQSSGTHTISSNTASTTTGSGALTIVGGLGVGGQLTVGTIVETSSIAFKKSIRPLDNALDSVLKLKGVVYDRKDGTTKNEVGLIAEEVYKVLPWLVSLDAKGKPYGIHYTKLTAYLVESIKALQDEIKELKGKK